MPSITSSLSRHRTGLEEQSTATGLRKDQPMRLEEKEHEEMAHRWLRAAR
jgi:hypothetical protein